MTPRRPQTAREAVEQIAGLFLADVTPPWPTATHPTTDHLEADAPTTHEGCCCAAETGPCDDVLCPCCGKFRG